MAVAIVTGGSVGIGRACVLALAEDGFDVGFTFREREREALAVASKARSLGARVSVRRADFLAQLDEVTDAIDSLMDELGTPAAFVNNAGISPRSPFLRETSDALERTLRVNFTVPCMLSQAAAAAMVDHEIHGSIVNVTSVLAKLPLEQCGAYCASKAALELHTRVQALELSTHGVRVNAVAPGHTATPMNYAEEADAARQIERQSIPMRRAADPDEVASAVRFLVSRRASYITGTTLTVDGGLSLPNGPGALQDEMGLPPAPASLSPTD